MAAACAAVTDIDDDGGGDDDDDGCCGGDDHLSGSLLRCAQQRPLGIPMGLQGSPRSPPEMRDATESSNPEVQRESANES